MKIEAATSSTGDAGARGLALAFLLLALAGWVDAVGIAQWGELYVGFMSGNTVALGASPAIGHGSAGWEAGRALLCFLAGIVLGELVGPAAGRWRLPAVVSTEAALLWLATWSAAAGWGELATTAICGLAMGVQTAAVHKAAGIALALTYVTGTLVNLGRAMAAALRGDAPWRKALPFAGFWTAMLAGGGAGSFVARADLVHALVGAAGIASALAVYAAVATRLGEG